MTDRPYLDDGDVVVYLADCVDAMRAMPADSVDAIVTDPPYGLGFMGREWDSFGGVTFGQESAEERTAKAAAYAAENAGAPRYANSHGTGRMDARESAAFQEWATVWAREALRVAKPGAHLCAFGGTRTFHRLACAIEDAGWEVRDCAAWMYGSGFPKSLDVSKAIDKAAGAERSVPRSWGANGEGHDPKGTLTGRDRATAWCEACGRSRGSQPGNCQCDTVGRPATPDAEAWAGWGTALKPAWEPIIVARKPLVGTVAANVLAHGTGALNIDACRIGTDTSRGDRYNGVASGGGGGDVAYAGRMEQPWDVKPGRWPANVVLDEDAAAILDEQTGDAPPKPGRSGRKGGNAGALGAFAGSSADAVGTWPADAGGGASRFFYTAKADREERVAPDGTRNTHPTVKPTDLMRWLVRLVTPPGGVVFDPFAGSGSTGVAARAEGFRAILVEREADYASIIASRLAQQTLL